MRYGSSFLQPSKNVSMSTMRSFRTRSPRIGSTVTLGATSLTSTLHARSFLPLITMASEPQIPCAQDRRSASVPSCRHFTSCSASSTWSHGSMSTVNSSHHGSSRTSGLNRRIRSVSSIYSPARSPYDRPEIISGIRDPSDPEQDPHGKRRPSHRGPVTESRHEPLPPVDPKLMMHRVAEPVGPVIQGHDDQDAQGDLGERMAREVQHPLVGQGVVGKPTGREGDPQDGHVDRQEKGGHHPPRREEGPKHEFRGGDGQVEVGVLLHRHPPLLGGAEGVVQGNAARLLPSLLHR